MAARSARPETRPAGVLGLWGLGALVALTCLGTGIGVVGYLAHDTRPGFAPPASALESCQEAPRRPAGPQELTELDARPAAACAPRPS